MVNEGYHRVIKAREAESRRREAESYAIEGRKAQIVKYTETSPAGEAWGEALSGCKMRKGKR